jgi:TolB-like protein/Tfp pilus assembly protein PilF
MPAELLQFDNFELDRGAYELRRAGRKVRLEPIPFELLILLVERRGLLVTRAEIIERIWGKDVFVDTDHSINTAVRKIRLALCENPDAPRFVVTLPGKGYRFVAPVRENAADSLAAVKSNRIMLVVLPFENLSNDPEQEYFSDGLTEETITNLGQLDSDRLGVIARTSAMSYKGTRKNIAEIGRELGADFALEGSVRRQGDRVRISAQLIRTSDQTHLWAHNYDRELKDFLAVQRELGRAIAEQVQVRLTPEQRTPREGACAVDPAAFDAYLRGRHYLWRVTRPNIERAIEYFREATRIDPCMALAHAGLADAYDVLPITSDFSPREAFPKAEQAAKQALEIDPDLAEAHAALGGMRFWYSWDWPGAEEHCRRAIARNASYAMARLRYGHLLSNIGRHEEAFAEMELARQLDPLSLIINTLRAQFRYQARQYDEAALLLGKALELDPNFWVAHINLANLYHQQERFDEALAAAEKAREFSGGNTQALSLVAYACATLGRRSEAEQILAQLLALEMHQYVSPYNIAIAHLGLGRAQMALDWLSKGYDDRDVRMVFLAVEPKWDSIRITPQFESILHRMNLPT